MNWNIHHRNWPFRNSNQFSIFKLLGSPIFKNKKSRVFCQYEIRRFEFKSKLFIWLSLIGWQIFVNILFGSTFLIGQKTLLYLNSSEYSSIELNRMEMRRTCYVLNGNERRRRVWVVWTCQALLRLTHTHEMEMNKINRTNIPLSILVKLYAKSC